MHALNRVFVQMSSFTTGDYEYMLHCMYTVVSPMSDMYPHHIHVGGRSALDVHPHHVCRWGGGGGGRRGLVVGSRLR